MKFTLCNSSQPVVDEKKVVCVSMCTCDVHIHITVIFPFSTRLPCNPKILTCARLVRPLLSTSNQ